MVELSSAYVLDTFAVLAHFQAETGGEKVKELRAGWPHWEWQRVICVIYGYICK
jgi:hypothetical protein